MGPLPPVLLCVALLIISGAWGQVEFLSLPDTVSIKESSPIGTSVHSFSLLNCTNSNPAVTITAVIPPATYFNTPTQTVSAGPVYNLQRAGDATPQHDPGLRRSLPAADHIFPNGRAGGSVCRRNAQSTSPEGRHNTMEFLSLPDTVSIKESSPIGTSVHSFSLLNCTNSNPAVTLSCRASLSLFTVTDTTVLYGLDLTSGIFSLPILSRITPNSLCLLFAVEFLSLPDTVSIKESSPIGTSVHSFSLLNCTNSNPAVTITAVIPPATYFNTPTQTVSAGPVYNLQITLSSTATLNAQVVNEYILEITAVCGNDTAIGKLFVKIIDDLPEPQCEPKFASQVGDNVQVYSNVPASSTIYNVVLRLPRNVPVTYKITSPIPSLFTITSNGNVQSPAAGFANVNARFQLQITVTDSTGNTCNGTLTVEVLPVYRNTVNFTSSSYSVTIPENGGPGNSVTTVKANGISVLYELVNPSTAYYIEPASGMIKTTFNLDLDANPSLRTTVLEVRAYNRSQHTDSATATVTITVTDVNNIAPRCSPAIVVTEVPQTAPLGQSLANLVCTDPDYNSTGLTYSITSNANSLYSFRMVGSDLQINKTLNYDSYEMASVNFQYAATVVVTDNGTPKMTTNIPVFITVTPVNNYPPACVGPVTYSISESAAFGAVVGQFNATDADYPFNNVRYSIDGAGSPPVFYIVPRTGEIKLLGPLDFETKASYSLKITVVDLNNDIVPDPANQKTAFCPITINVQDFNDNPPICTPPFYSATIYSTLLTTTPIVSLSCSDKDVSNPVLFYSIVGGNDNNRFRMGSPTSSKDVLHNPFSYNTDGGIYDRTQYELLIRVTDSTTSPVYSTTATVFITVVPWTTTQPTTTSTTPIPVKQTAIVNKTLEYWQPDIWFMVVLTITAALFLAGIGLLTWALCTRYPLCARGPTEATQPLLQDRSLQNADPPANKNQQPPPPSKEKKDVAPVSPLSLQFDGRAQDPVTGREYLFNSHTGERRWI
ncbi:PREDICTED: cadherin-related family member 4 [Nanorana parkeri]|uniref:cadherin-related family member 4 n=1 Tax=Nanorana parkeri TaxID=125878 RepID=UPI0008549A97|nr:PREDICTED: cadherin-related family member 4 [Nanorana parkeri]